MKKISDTSLIEKLISDEDFDKNAAEEIKEMIIKERSKPESMQNYDTIAELSHAYSEIMGSEEKLTEMTEEGINNVIAIADKQTAGRRFRHTKRFRITASMILASAVIIGANAMTVSAYNKNIVSTIIYMTKGGVTVNFKEADINETETDPYGMLAECAKYDIYPEVPYYIPEGFELEHTSNSIVNGVIHKVSFDFKSKNKKQIIRLDFVRYFKDVGDIRIASDKYNISETVVNGHPAVVSKEDDQYVIVFLNEKTKFYMFTQDVPYDECDKIVASIR